MTNRHSGVLKSSIRECMKHQRPRWRAGILKTRLEQQQLQHDDLGQSLAQTAALLKSADTLKSTVESPNVLCQPCDFEQTGSEVLSCKLCGFECDLMRKNQFTKHMRTHTINAKICCDAAGCEYQALNIADFKEHMYTHQWMKYTHDWKAQYSCDVSGCGYCTTIQADLQKHLMAHLCEKPYQCVAPGCGYSVWNRVVLDTHMQKKTHKSGCYM